MNLIPEDYTYLDALWPSGAPTGWLFLQRREFVEMFNVPWNGLDAVRCGNRIGMLLQAKILSLQANPCLDRVDIHLTAKGGRIWEERFKVVRARHISDSYFFPDEGGTRVTYSGVSRSHIDRFRRQVVAALGTDAAVGAVTWNPGDDMLYWRRRIGAYEFALSSDLGDFCESDAGQCLHELKLRAIQGWRAPSLRFVAAS